MKLKESPLRLDEFVVLQLEHKFISPTKQFNTIDEIFDEYEIDLDFGFREFNENFIELRVKAGINLMETPLPGYSIFIETAGIFSIEGDIEDETYLQNLKIRSTLGMQINFLRTSLANFSSYFPLGKYWLPSVDINALIEEKQLKKQVSGKRKKVK